MDGDVDHEGNKQPNNVTALFSYPEVLKEDLMRSGLLPEDIRARAAGANEKAATNTAMGAEGYVIPYFGLDGKAIPFYRLRLYNVPEGGSRYRQLAETTNHVYFPPKLGALLPNAKFIVLTEGEKKAACAVKRGIPTCALGGVDNWRSRTLDLPKDTSLSQKPDGTIIAKLPQRGIARADDGPIAKGMDDLIRLVLDRNIPLVIAYDTEYANKNAKYNVQRAAATLGYELRFNGIPFRNIRQLHLAPPEGFGPPGPKLGLDDLLLMDGGQEAFYGQLRDCLNKRSAFPLHPNIREYVNKQLSRHNLARQGKIALALAVLADLDEQGQRLRNKDSGSLYYFHSKSKALMPVEFTGKPDFAESPFGRHLYKNYNLGINDVAALSWVSSQFSGEEPIADVIPERVLTWRGDTLYYQLSDGQIARITHTDLTIIDNGSDDVLFESGLTEAVDTKEFLAEWKRCQVGPDGLGGGGAIDNWWAAVLREARMAHTDSDNHRRLLSLLYYVSPFFYRWRGTQLPVEITTGEAGSGKSTLYELRLGILTGIPHLRNAPKDQRDWDASVAGSGALHVTDNMQFADSQLRQRLSDELCRLITEPRPTIEQRKLYTNVGVVRIPVRCVFGITAIRQPFTNVDIIQRSIITELDKGTDLDLTYDAQWKERQLASRGGRPAWLAHHLYVVHRTLQEAHKSWSNGYQARYRLINVEQLLKLTARVFGWDYEWIPYFLEQDRDRRASETDWTLEGVQAYSRHLRETYPNWRDRRFTAGDISAWAQAEDEFNQCQLLISSRSLGRYIKQHQHTVSVVAGIIGQEFGNRIVYKLRS